MGRIQIRNQIAFLTRWASIIVSGINLIYILYLITVFEFDESAGISLAVLSILLATGSIITPLVNRK
jgi:hypothetical protein